MPTPGRIQARLPSSAHSDRYLDGKPPGFRVGNGGGGIGGGGGCGLPCVVKVFGFLCSQLLRRGGGGGNSGVSGGGMESTGGFGGAVGGGGGGGVFGGSGAAVTPTPRRVLCLRLIKTAVAEAGPALALYPPLLDMVQDDLCFSLLQLVQTR